MSATKHSEEDRRAVGRRLAAARERRDFTQKHVADLMGITKAALSAWEQGRNIPDAIMLRRLARIYETTADNLLADGSLTPNALQVAIHYDSLTVEQQSLFHGMWRGFLDATQRKDMTQPDNDSEHTGSQNDPQPAVKTPVSTVQHLHTGDGKRRRIHHDDDSTSTGSPDWNFSGGKKPATKSTGKE